MPSPTPHSIGFIHSEAVSRSRKMTFTGSHGEPLAGRLDLPIGPVRAVALFAHCFTCDKETVTASRISRRLAEHGGAVLRFDFTGLGESGGDFRQHQLHVQRRGPGA